MAKLKFIKKLAVFTGGSSLELTVTKQLGPVATSADVASTGTDDAHFSDKKLTPGPAMKPLNPANSYSILWQGAFVKDGSATLTVRVLDATGKVLTTKVVSVAGQAGDVFFRIILVP